MDLIGSGFARKILFHVIQSNIKVSSSLDRTTTPLILRHNEAEQVYTECFWLCYYQLAVATFKK